MRIHDLDGLSALLTHSVVVFPLLLSKSDMGNGIFQSFLFPFFTLIAGLEN